MHTEAKIGDKQSEIEIISQEKNFYHVRIGNKEYQLDIERVEDGVYSIIHKGRSIDMVMIEGEKQGQYIANTLHESFDIDIIDAQTKYRSRTNAGIESSENIISTPMPGKIVKILVTKGDKVTKGETLIIVSAMKMESEYKAPFDAIVKSVKVKEDDTVTPHQPLIELELQA